VAKSASAVADDFRTLLFASGKDAKTFSWPAFSRACGRERLKEAFLEDLRTELKNRSISIAYGMASVGVLKDYDFDPF
jgi:hypothetical protein